MTQHHSTLDLVAIGLLLLWSLFWMMACLRAWRRIDSDADLLGQRATELAEEMAEVDSWRMTGRDALLALRRALPSPNRHTEAHREVVIKELVELLEPTGLPSFVPVPGQYDGGMAVLDRRWPGLDAAIALGARVDYAGHPMLEEVSISSVRPAEREYFGQPDEIPGAL